MNETIHYISSISYITDTQHLKKHINYITRASAKPIYTLTNDRINTWIERAEHEKSKRYDARIAMKFVLALPNDKINDKNFFQKVGIFLSELFHVPTNHIDLAIHRDNTENLHVHVLIYPRREDGKKLRLGKSDLSNFHRAWDDFLKKEGYKVVKDSEDERLYHLGWKLHKDPELKISYNNYKSNKRKIKEYTNVYEKIESEEKRIQSEIEYLTLEENRLLIQYHTILAEQEKEKKKKQKEYIEQRIKQLQDSLKRIEDLQKTLKDIEYIRLMHYLINDTKNLLDKIEFPENLVQEKNKQPIESKEIKETSLKPINEKLDQIIDSTSKLLEQITKLKEARERTNQNTITPIEPKPKYKLTEEKKDTNTNVVKVQISQTIPKIKQQTLNPRYDLLEYYYLLKQEGKKNRDFVIECVNIGTPLEDIAVALAYIYKTDFDKALEYVKHVVSSEKEINNIENLDKKSDVGWRLDI